MASVRGIISFWFISGALGLMALSAPLFVVNAQEQEIEDIATTTTEVAAQENTQSTTRKQEFDPSALGIKTESIPNAEDVVGDFVVGPGIFEAFGNPGDVITKELLITNRTGIDRRFNIEVEDMIGSQDGSQSIILLGDDRGPYSIKDYLSFPATSFDLKHGQRARFPVTITIPEDAEPGGFYGSVLVNTVTVPTEHDPEAGRAAVRSPLVKRIGSLFFVTVPGDNIYEGALKDFSLVPQKQFYEKGPFKFVVTFENTGASHLNPYGEIKITNMFGEEVGFVELSPWFSLPNSVRLREVSWNRDMLYGKYTATVALNRGYEDIVDEMSFTFWVIPWKLVLLVFGAVFLVFFLIRTFFKKFEFSVKAK